MGVNIWSSPKDCFGFLFLLPYFDHSRHLKSAVPPAGTKYIICGKWLSSYWSVLLYGTIVENINWHFDYTTCVELSSKSEGLVLLAFCWYSIQVIYLIGKSVSWLSGLNKVRTYKWAYIFFTIKPALLKPTR